MFVKVVPNNKGRKDTFFIYLTVRSLGLFEKDQVPYIKAAFMVPKPRLVYDGK